MDLYEKQDFIIPTESADYNETSKYVIAAIEGVVEQAIQRGENRIVLNTNLRHGLPMENINKIAGPFVEAWAGELFESISLEAGNRWHLVHTEPCQRLGMADFILQFQKATTVGAVVTAQVDSKATAEDLATSGKMPNITSFARIRSAYIEDADFLFVILSLKHRVYGRNNPQTGLKDGIMEVVGYNAYDMKHISEADLIYNPALGSGQLQIKDIHHVELQERTTWEFCQLLDSKYLASSKRTFQDWRRLAQKNGWIR
ncbi:MAG: restriction endonuclease [Bacteroidales bacterium]|nr:restriction endonuclease [Bacteroidales bacterium]